MSVNNLVLCLTGLHSITNRLRFRKRSGRTSKPPHLGASYQCVFGILVVSLRCFL